MKHATWGKIRRPTHTRTLNFDPGQGAKPGLKLKKITQMRKQLIVTDIKL